MPKHKWRGRPWISPFMEHAPFEIRAAQCQRGGAGLRSDAMAGVPCRTAMQTNESYSFTNRTMRPSITAV